MWIQTSSVLVFVIPSVNISISKFEANNNSNELLCTGIIGTGIVTTKYAAAVDSSQTGDSGRKATAVFHIYSICEMADTIDLLGILLSSTTCSLL